MVDVLLFVSAATASFFVTRGLVNLLIWGSWKPPSQTHQPGECRCDLARLPADNARKGGACGRHDADLSRPTEKERSA